MNRVSPYGFLVVFLFCSAVRAEQKSEGPIFGSTALKLTIPLGHKVFQTSEVSQNSLTPLNLLVGSSDTLHFSYALKPEAWLNNSYRYEYKVLVSVPQKKEIELFRMVLDPSLQINNLGWQNVTLSLSDFAGQKVAIKFKKRVLNRNKKPISSPSQEKWMVWGAIRVGNFQRAAGEYNVILVSLDTLRGDRMGLSGYFRNTTPNLDALARKGVYFKNAVSQSPWTKPSHMSLMTGLYPTSHGVTQSWQTRQKIELARDKTTLADVFRTNGYLTQAFTGSANVAANFGFYRGFDHYIEAGRAFGPDAKFIFSNGFDWIESHADKKFFLFLHTYEIHRPFTRKFFVNQLPPDATPKERINARYDSDVYYTDKFIGHLEAKLRSLDILDKTILVIFSDHGEDLMSHYGDNIDHGHTLYEEMIHVPLIFHAPGLFPASIVKTYQAQLIDVMPTLLDLFKFPHDDLPLQGESLAPILKGGTPPEESLAFSESLAYEPERKMVRYVQGTSQYKFILALEFDDPGFRLKKNSSRGWEKKMFTNLNDWNGKEFYDLVADPEENANKIDKGDTHIPFLEDKLRSLLKILPHFKPSTGNETSIDEDLHEQLKSLGY